MTSWSSLYVFVIFMAVLLWPAMEYNKNNDVDPNPLFDIFFFFDIELKFFFKVPLLEKKQYVAFLIKG